MALKCSIIELGVYIFGIESLIESSCWLPFAPLIYVRLSVCLRVAEARRQIGRFLI